MGSQSRKVKKTGRRSRCKRFFLAIASVAMTGCVALSALVLVVQQELPDVSTLGDMHLQVPMKIYTRNGTLIAQYGEKRRQPVPLSAVPPLLVKAVLATEDARFYDHPGVDFVGLMRAAVVMLKSGRKAQGASTITMQVARNFYLTREKTFTRKLKEILLAIKIDQYFTKDKILSLYLNKIYFGNRAYGVAAAAQVYYGRPLSALTLPEMAMIAGLPQSPSRNNPLRRPQAALKRRNHVLGRMLQLGNITQTQYDTAIKAPVTARYHRLSTPYTAPYVAEWVRQQVLTHYGAAAYERGLNIYTSITEAAQNAANEAVHTGLLDYERRHGYTGPEAHLPILERPIWLTLLAQRPQLNWLPAAVVTAVYDKRIDVQRQDGSVLTLPWSALSWARPRLEKGKMGARPQRASDIVQVGDVIRLRQVKQPASKPSWQLVGIPATQAALVSLDPKSGEILACVGGFSHRLSVFNRVFQAKRQPGSSFKPFIYSAGLWDGMTLASVVNDSPITIADSGENTYWRPQNDSRHFYGPTTLRRGLERSRNLVSIRILRHVGVDKARSYLQHFGFEPAQMPASLSLALGAGLVTPIQMARAYAILANTGHWVQPRLIDHIEVMQADGQYRLSEDKWPMASACIADADGSIQTLPQCQAQVITPQNAFLMTQALRGVIQHGTGRAARVLKRQSLAGKTGTTNKQVDAWFAGYSPSVATIVWVGKDNMRPIYEYGSKAALPIWIQFMKSALAGKAHQIWQPPAGIVAVRIHPKTGQLVTNDTHDAVMEYFRTEHMPILREDNTQVSAIAEHPEDDIF